LDKQIDFFLDYYGFSLQFGLPEFTSFSTKKLPLSNLFQQFYLHKGTYKLFEFKNLIKLPFSLPSGFSQSKLTTINIRSTSTSQLLGCIGVDAMLDSAFTAY
jgi:hypothetical protein